MPTYDYVCKHCGHEFEAFQSITDHPLARCPKCRRNGLTRLIGAGAGIIFKGSGFYITDYRRRSGAPSSAGKDKDAAKKKDADSAAD